jgi:peptide subunit release factor 1 (eRF1)
VTRALSSFEDGFLPARGFFAFATEAGLRYSEGVPARMPDLVRWKKGVRMAPLVRALKQERAVTVVLADSRRVRLFELVEGTIRELDGLRADTFVGDLTDVGMSKSASRSSGTRGETSTDQAQRILGVAADRMAKEVAQAVEDRAGDEGLVIVGGPIEGMRRIMTALPDRLRARAMERPSMHLDMTLAEVLEEARAGAGDMSEREHEALAKSIVDAARSRSLGALGRKETERALTELRVDTLLLSRSFISGNPDVADRMVAEAFGQSAHVEEASGSAGAYLDREAEGVAARLRFAVPKPA